jgi:hypothetical protein
MPLLWVVLLGFFWVVLAGPVTLCGGLAMRRVELGSYVLCSGLLILGHTKLFLEWFNDAGMT